MVPIPEKSGPYLVPFRDLILVGPDIATLVEVLLLMFLLLVLDVVTVLMVVLEMLLIMQTGWHRRERISCLCKYRL